jgi:hypothetical protein
MENKRELTSQQKMEAAMERGLNEYFKARPQLDQTIAQMAIFRAAYWQGWADSARDTAAEPK